MIIAVDIGNTAISFGVLKNKKVKTRLVVEVCNSKLKLCQSIVLSIKQLIKKHPLIHSVVICSVVPDLTKVVQEEIKKHVALDHYLIGESVKVPIKNNYKIPSQVGHDRLVGAYAAKALYGSPVIIIDFGTAITFDVVSKNGAYEGGIIVPGVKLSTQALFDNTALLPLVDRINPPKSLIGRDTKHSILSGVYYGYGEMCKGLIKRISNELNGKPKVVITGGYTDSMKNFISAHIDVINPDLVFIGMGLLLENEF